MDPGTSSRPSRRRQRDWRWVVVGALVCLAVALVILGRTSRVAPLDNRPPMDAPRQAARERVEDRASGPAAHGSAVPKRVVLVEDDGRTLWASPTDGPPLELAYLPPGAQIILAVRPADLLRHPEGPKVRAALGPYGDCGIQFVERATGLPIGQIDRLLVGWQTNQDGGWEVALVATVTDKRRGARGEGPAASDKSFERYEPAAENGRVIVVASPAAIEDVKQLAGRAPPLRRDIHRLLAHTDADRLATLLVVPRFLQGDGKDLFSGEMEKLRSPLLSFFGDDLAAVLLSLHWDEDFFVELCAVPTLEVLPERAAEQLAGRVSQLPDQVDQYVVGLNPDPYGRRVVARFPAMVRKLAAYTRSGFDRDRAILRCYLPAVAGHNLLLGAELTLAEPPATAARPLPSVGTRRGERPETAASVTERLQQHTTLRFPRDTLEAALDMLAHDVGVEIILVGRDLQLEGITKNQSFGLDLEDRPAAEILVEILRQANPDKSAAGPGDERQKLVYVIKPQAADGPEAVFVTTRAAAGQRGDPLPDVFVRP